MKIRFIAALLVAAGISAQVQAQTINIVNNGGSRDAGSKVERVSVSFQLSTPTPAPISAPDWTNTIQTASRNLYDAVDHECQVLSVSLKGDCRLVQLSTNGNVNGRTNSAETTVNVNVSVSATYEITGKPGSNAAPTAN